MALKAIDTLIEPTPPLWTRLLLRTDFTAPSGEHSLEFHPRNTWLQCLSGPTEEPLDLGAGRSLQRHATHRLAIL